MSSPYFWHRDLSVYGSARISAGALLRHPKSHRSGVVVFVLLRCLIYHRGVVSVFAHAETNSGANNGWRSYTRATPGLLDRSQTASSACCKQRRTFRLHVPVKLTTI